MASKSIQKAVNNHCKGCLYDKAEKGTWVDQVERCVMTNCELYHHRPLTAKTRQINKEKYLATLTPSERELYQIRLKNRALNLLNIKGMINNESTNI